LLEQGGFAQYEISNFARNGLHSRHNLTDWQCGDYLGIGPAAHSFLDGKRFFFPRDLDSFLGLEKPFDHIIDDGSGGGLAERLMLSLRLTKGFDMGLLPPEATANLLKKAAPLIQRGLIRHHGDQISLSPEGFLLSNPITATLLESIDL
jgi:oxygen-independent coproporphyrinogen-3 oxidase